MSGAFVVRFHFLGLSSTMLKGLLCLFVDDMKRYTKVDVFARLAPFLADIRYRLTIPVF